TYYFYFSSRRQNTRFSRDWSSDVCSSDLQARVRPLALGGLLVSGGERGDLQARRLRQRAAAPGAVRAPGRGAAGDPVPQVRSPAPRYAAAAAEPGARRRRQPSAGPRAGRRPGVRIIRELTIILD